MRRRLMEEREKPTEKRCHVEHGIFPSLRRRTLLFYIVRMTLATLLAVGGYSLYRYVWR